MHCPECERERELVTLCDFCGNSYCHSCDPQLHANNNRLCTWCISLQKNVRHTEAKKTGNLRKKMPRLPMPKLVNGAPPHVTRNLVFDLLCITTKLVNRAARNKVTPGTSKACDRLWKEARTSLLSIGRSAFPKPNKT